MLRTNQPQGFKLYIKVSQPMNACFLVIFDCMVVDIRYRGVG